MQTTEQADLAQRLLEDDEQALEDVPRLFGPPVLIVLARRYQSVLRETDIEDVISIGLYRLWTNRARFGRRKASLKVWFFRIVENAALDVLRHGWHKARLLEVDSDSALLGATDASSNGHGKDDGKQSGAELSASSTPAPTNLQLDLREIVSELPDRQRHIVMADAAAREGVASSNLLGDELGVPGSTVRVYRKRAMDKIRSELTRRGHDVPSR
ncbi:MAG: sigma-70 family RNA polymerase sigma factor [Fuerstiella sp.]|nr:sigma-70 family RNA polymerase sigma factor [Fuerstiella sp.]